MNRKKKIILGAAGSVVALSAGMGVAEAASSGTFPTVSNSSNYTSNVSYNFYANKQGAFYSTNLAGHFVVNNPTAHMNAKNDGYGWKQLVTRSTKANVPFNWNLLNSDVVVADTASIQVCRDNTVLPDDCSDKTVHR